MTSYLGVDVSKATLEVLLLRRDSAPEPAQFDNSRPGFKRLHHWLKKRNVKVLHACLEATGTYGDELACFCTKPATPSAWSIPRASKPMATAA